MFQPKPEKKDMGQIFAYIKGPYTIPMQFQIEEKENEIKKEIAEIPKEVDAVEQFFIEVEEQVQAELKKAKDKLKLELEEFKDEYLTAEKIAKDVKEDLEPIIEEIPLPPTNIPNIIQDAEIIEHDFKYINKFIEDEKK